MYSTVRSINVFLHAFLQLFWKSHEADLFPSPLSLSLSSFVWSWTSRRCQTSASGRALEDVGRVLFPKNPQASYLRYINPYVWTFASLFFLFPSNQGHIFNRLFKAKHFADLFWQGWELFFFFFKLTVYVEFNLTVLLVFWENYFPQPVAHL